MIKLTQETSSNFAVFTGRSISNWLWTVRDFWNLQKLIVTIIKVVNYARIADSKGRKVNEFDHFFTSLFISYSWSYSETLTRELRPKAAVSAPPVTAQYEVNIWELDPPSPNKQTRLYKESWKGSQVLWLKSSKYLKLSDKLGYLDYDARKEQYVSLNRGENQSCWRKV